MGRWTNRLAIHLYFVSFWYEEPFVCHRECACRLGLNEQRCHIGRTCWRPFCLMFSNCSRGCLFWNSFPPLHYVKTHMHSFPFKCKSKIVSVQLTTRKNLCLFLCFSRELPAASVSWNYHSSGFFFFWVLARRLQMFLARGQSKPTSLLKKSP